MDADTSAGRPVVSTLETTTKKSEQIDGYRMANVLQFVCALHGDLNIAEINQSNQSTPNDQAKESELNDCPAQGISNHKHVMVVDDNARRNRELAAHLGAAGYSVTTARSGKQALDGIVTAQPRLVIADLHVEDMGGMALYDMIDARFPALPVIITADRGSVPQAVEATKRGVFDFLTQPIDDRSFHEAVERALRVGFSRGRSVTEGDDDSEWRREIVSQSTAMERLLRQARLVADTGSAVLIQSESGTGKELLARAIHRASGRRHSPFVAVNCSAIPETLLESELFGHVKGAFTGATHDRKGVFETAHRGTLFLDEIGDMSLMLQAALLRVLQEKEVRPVGSNETKPVDVRVISATHSNLDEAVARHQFREDLFYRLNVVKLELPSLSRRRQDIPLLVRHFSGEIARDNGRAVKRFSPEAMERLVGAHWPGNVRQLRNIVERTYALSTSPIIAGRLVGEALDAPPIGMSSLVQRRGEFERDYLTELLHTTQGNVTRAARLAQRNRTEFYRLLQRYRLNPQEFRPDR